MHNISLNRSNINFFLGLDLSLVSETGGKYLLCLQNDQIIDRITLFLHISIVSL